jgi:amino acid adenylation domain-containing protein
MYINRITSKNDIVIGTPVLNRSNRKDKNTTGMFINTLPLRINIDSDTNFKTFSSMVSMECMSLFRHQKYPYDLLLKDIRAKYNKLENLYDIVLSYQNSKMEKQVIDEQYMSRWHFNHHQVNSLTIHINDRDDDGRLIIDYDFHEDMYSVKEIEFLHTHMLSLLWHALDNPEKNINKIEMLPESEKNKVLYEFNNTKADYPKDKTIHQLFEEQVERTPDSIALVFEDTTMTYRELNHKANQLAHALREKGVRPDDIIALMMERSFDVVIGMLGILKAGAAFLSIDPDYPDERIMLMLKDSNAKILLSHVQLTDKVSLAIEILEIDSIKGTNECRQNLEYVNKPSDLAYVIYTSGSTGKPKGAMIEHRNLVNFIYGASSIMDFSAGVSVLSITTISFDIFIFEIFPSLVHGLKIIIANREQQLTPIFTLDLISKYNIEIIHGTPSRIQALIDDKTQIACVKKLKKIIIGGEVFSYKLLKTLKKITTARIFNGYGPTETTVGVTFKELSETNIINIGRPINNICIYILDKHMNPVPIGIPGDLYIGGDSVGRGYINRPLETKFVPNPFIPGDIIYKSGDMARWYPKGEIEFLGRIDQQVKINGLRIELTEIENQLSKIDGIRQAVVVVHENKTEKKLLCGYYVADKEIPSLVISTQLSKHLPNYMIPSIYTRVDLIPYTHNGKVDINNLPQVNMREAAIKSYVAPRNDTERKLVELWKEVLCLDVIGIDSSFFELGGDSLAAIKLQVKLLGYNWNIKIQDLYKYSTIRALSEKIAYDANKSLPRTVKVTSKSDNGIVGKALTNIKIKKTSYNNKWLSI